MRKGLSIFTAPQVSLLRRLGLNANQQIFWVLYLIVEYARERGPGPLNLRCELFEEIGQCLCVDANSVDSCLRRFADEIKRDKERYFWLYLYLPNYCDRPIVSELISGWLCLVADFERDMKEDELKTEADSSKE